MKTINCPLAGGEFQLDVSSVREALRALIVQIPGFREKVAEGRFELLRDGRSIDRAEAECDNGSWLRLDVLPALAGSKSGTAMAVTKVVVGVALIALAVFAPPVGAAGAAGAGGAAAGGAAGGAAAGGAATAAATGYTIAGVTIAASSIGLLGVSFILGGVSAFFTGQSDVGADMKSTDQSDDRAAFLFNGVVNVSAQGNVVPLVFGTVETGSVVISGGLIT